MGYHVIEHMYGNAYSDSSVIQMSDLVHCVLVVVRIWQELVSLRSTCHMWCSALNG